MIGRTGATDDELISSHDSLESRRSASGGKTLFRALQ
jgi:hypothetical protein